MRNGIMGVVYTLIWEDMASQFRFGICSYTDKVKI